MARVLLINQPFSNLRWPNLGLSLLKAALTERGIGCDIAYLNFDFAERVGLDAYSWIADDFAFVLGGERLFAKHFFAKLPGDDRYFRDVLVRADSRFTPEDRGDYEAIGQAVQPFLEAAMGAIDWPQYAIVGFAATFQQTMPAMCLARRIKRAHPEIRIVLGGAACEAEMGLELLRQFSEIDYVFLGEADLAFPPVVEQILAGGHVDLPAGVASRDPAVLTGRTGASRVTAGSEPLRVCDLDALPYPEFDDYFARHDRSPLRDRIEPLLFYETSRGCWWGEKHHCKFCGLNGSSMQYRSKSPERAVEELRWLVERHKVSRACAADNILDHRYFETFLPMLHETGLDLGLAYEMKTNLTRRQVALLLDAGLGAAQLGIETFITPVLKLMAKGANAMQNLQALKWLSEPGIEVKWNVLYGFPGEIPADYARLADLIPSLVHLAPPMAVGRVRLDRFSPYFEEPARYGMVNPRPNRAFSYVYPFSGDVLARIAYYYDYDYADGRDPLDYAGPVLEAIDRWREIYGTVTLRLWDREDGVLILTDTRPCATQFQRRLTGLERQIYLLCDTGRSLRYLVEHAAQLPAATPRDAGQIQQLLDQWVGQRIMACLDDRYLSLALCPAPE